MLKYSRVPHIITLDTKLNRSKVVNINEGGLSFEWERALANDCSLDKVRKTCSGQEA
jgi:hypothetical protein